MSSPLFDPDRPNGIHRALTDLALDLTGAMNEHFARAITSIRDVVERSLTLRRDREEAAAAARSEVAGRLAEIVEMQARLAAVIAQVEGEPA